MGEYMMMKAFKPFGRTLLLGGAVLFIAASALVTAQTARADDDEHGFLGVYLGDKAETCIGESKSSAGQGACVEGVVENGPAEKAGIEKGDVIVRVNGETVEDSDDLRGFIRKTHPGDKVMVVVKRQGKEKTFTVTMGEPDDEGLFSWVKPFVYGAPHSLRKKLIMEMSDRPWMGIEMQRLSDQLREYFKVKDGGVLISSVVEDSPAEKAGLKAGDVIVKIDDEEVENRRDVINTLKEKEAGDEISVTVIRNGKKKQKRVTLAESPHQGIEKYGYGDNDDDEIDIFCPDDLRGSEALKFYRAKDFDDFLKDLDVNINSDVKKLQKEIDQLKSEIESLKEKSK